MNIEIICVGKLKEKYWQEAADEYIKRLGRFARLTVTELPEERLRGSSPADEAAVPFPAGDLGEYVIALA